MSEQPWERERDLHSTRLAFVDSLARRMVEPVPGDQASVAARALVALLDDPKPSAPEQRQDAVWEVIEQEMAIRRPDLRQVGVYYTSADKRAVAQAAIDAVERTRA